MENKQSPLQNMAQAQDKKNHVLEIFMIILAVVFFIPVIFVVISAFRPQTDIIMNPVVLGSPLNLTLENFSKAWTHIQFPLVFLNTFTLTLASVAGVVLFSSMAAYIMVRTRFKKVGWFLFGFFTFAMLIPFQVLMVPLVKIAKDWRLLDLQHLATDQGTKTFLKTLGIIPMYWGLLAPLAIFMYHGFMKSVPLSLEESAHIDGAGPFQTFFQVVFPIMTPITATIVILDVLWVWNDFLLPLVVLGNGTIQLAQNSFIGAFGSDIGAYSASLVLSSLPVVLLYLFLQRFIIKGIAAGAVKG